MTTSDARNYHAQPCAWGREKEEIALVVFGNIQIGKGQGRMYEEDY
jgi:hypothetical protein